MASPNKSMYEEVWQKVKAGQTVVLEAEVRYHARIKRMISKHKDMDTAFKLKHKLDGRTILLKFWIADPTTSPKQLSIKLRQTSLGADDL